MANLRATTPAGVAAMTRAAARPAGRRRFNALFVLLVVSLAANAFIVGHLLVQRFGHPPHDQHARIMQMELRYLVDRLPPDAVAKVTGALDTLRPDIDARIARLKALHGELDALSAAPVPDRAAIDARLRDIRIEVGAMQEQVQSRTFDALLALPPADRAPLAQPAREE